MKDFDDLAGVELIGIKDGVGHARVKLKDESLNAIGTVHGGLLTTLADTVAGNTLARLSGRVATTVQANLNFINPVFGGDYIYGRAEIVKEGRNVSTVDTEITDDDGNLIATGRFVFFHFNKEIKMRD